MSCEPRKARVIQARCQLQVHPPRMNKCGNGDIFLVFYFHPGFTSDKMRGSSRAVIHWHFWFLFMMDSNVVWNLRCGLLAGQPARNGNSDLHNKMTRRRDGRPMPTKTFATTANSATGLRPATKLPAAKRETIRVTEEDALSISVSLWTASWTKIAMTTTTVRTTSVRTGFASTKPVMT